jgi:4-coumarate--CoA ligase
LVIDCAVVGCFSEKENLWLITAFVTLKKHSQEVEEVKKEILEITKAQLSDLKQIRGGLYVLEDLPKNNTGKIDRRALRQYKADMCCY